MAGAPLPFWQSPKFNVRPGVDMSGMNPQIRGLLETLAKNGGVESFDITSGYRDPSRNAAVGGAKGSQHTHGNATDISTKGWTDDQRSNFLKAAVEGGAKGVGIYPNGSFHFDTRETPAAWGVGGSYRSSPIDTFPEWARPHLTSLLGGKGGTVTAAAMPAAAASPSIPSLLGNPTGASSAVANFGLTGPKGLDAPALPTAAAATMQPQGMTPSAPDAGKGLMDDKDFTGGLGMLAKAFGGGNKSASTGQLTPMSNYGAEQAARIPAAQALMSQILMKNKMPRGMLG